MPRMSLSSWLLINIGVRLVLRKHHDIERFEREFTTNQANGPAPLPRRFRQRLDVESTHIAGTPCLVVKARGTTPRQRVLYLHGGAYVFEMISEQWTLIAGMAEQTAAEVIVPTYGLAPRSTVMTTMPRMVSLVDTLREDPRPLALAGDSAGGGLALALTHQLRDVGKPPPTALVLFFPWLDVTLADPDQDGPLARADLTLSPTLLRHAGRLWAGDLSPTDARVSPLFGHNHHLPPTIALAGGADLLVSDCRRLAVCSSAVVREYPGMFHGWICVGTPEGKAALAEAMTFLRTQFNNKSYVHGGS